MQVVRLKFVKKFIKLIKITNCVCGHICNSCDVAVVCAECVHTFVSHFNISVVHILLNEVYHRDNAAVYELQA